MEIFVILAMLAGVGLAINEVRWARRRYQQPMIPIGRCRQCDEDILATDDYVELTHGVYICLTCAPGILDECEEIIPYWFEQPLVDGEPAQRPVPQLESTAEVFEISGPPEPITDSTTYQCGECRGEHPQHTVCPKMPPIKGVVVSRVPLFDGLTEAEQMKWIMTGQSGRGDVYDVQMMSQYRRWLNEQGKVA